MDLIGRLRPRWRHPDAAVRAAAVRDMGADDQSRLGTVATDDPDPHVRRIAIKKLEDVALLQRLAESDADQALRDLAVERAREVLIRIACSDRAPAECEAALERLTDERSFAAVASTGAHEHVRQGALDKVSSDRVLRDVVRTAADPAIRRAALDRIRDAGVLRGIALGDSAPELALRALDRIDDGAALQLVAENRGAAKQVRQRARELLATRSAEGPAIAVKDARARQVELSATVHMLRAMTDVMAAAERVREAQREWRELARVVEPRPDVADPFTAACDSILRDEASLARRRAAVYDAQSALEESIVARTALCEQVDALDGADAPQALAEARAAWSRLRAVPDARGAALSRRFDAACESCTARHERWLAGEALRVDRERAVQEAETLAESSPVPKGKTWAALERRWQTLGTPTSAGDELERRFAAAADRFRGRRQETDQRRSQLERDNRARLETLCTRLQALATAEKCKPSAGRRELQVADAALSDLGPLPASERRAEWMERLTDARDQLLRRVSREEQTEEWRRWANVGAQEEIIARVEALLESNDLAEGVRQLAKLQEDWAQVATASPEKSRGLWERFRTARNELRRRCDAYLAANLEKKRALCEQAAPLGDSTAWNETTELIRRLQAEWKEIGPVPAKLAAALWRQFREPCDRFFARRKEQFDQLDAERNENAKRKTALCEQAEALADSTDWEVTATAFRELQAEWKRSGPPPRREADALWRRFRAACDHFFDRRNRREELAREAVARSAQVICEEVEALARAVAGEDALASDEIGQKVDQAWGEWLRLDRAALDDSTSLASRLHAACEQIAARRPESFEGTRLDPEATRKRREKLCARLEALLETGREAPRATSLREMAMALRERLAANTIAGSGAEPGRLQDVDQEIARIASSWMHLGPLLDDDARALAERFERARARAEAESAQRR